LKLADGTILPVLPAQNTFFILAKVIKNSTPTTAMVEADFPTA